MYNTSPRPDFEDPESVQHYIKDRLVIGVGSCCPYLSLYDATDVQVCIV
jgi:hypothetical protein